MPHGCTLKVELFYVWEISFIGPFYPSHNSPYIFVTIDYVSKWVEVVTTLTNDSKVFINILQEEKFYQVWHTNDSFE